MFVPHALQGRKVQVIELNVSRVMLATAVGIPRRDKFLAALGFTLLTELLFNALLARQDSAVQRQRNCLFHVLLVLMLDSDNQIAPSAKLDLSVLIQKSQSNVVLESIVWVVPCHALHVLQVWLARFRTRYLSDAVLGIIQSGKLRIAVSVKPDIIVLMVLSACYVLLEPIPHLVEVAVPTVTLDHTARCPASSSHVLQAILVVLERPTAQNAQVLLVCISFILR